MTLCGKGCGGASWGRESKNCLRGGDAGQTWRGKQELARQVTGAGSAGVQSCRGVGAGGQCGDSPGQPWLARCPPLLLGGQRRSEALAFIYYWYVVVGNIVLYQIDHSGKLPPGLRLGGGTGGRPDGCLSFHPAHRPHDNGQITAIPTWMVPVS